MLSCSEFTGVRLIDLLEMCGADLKKGRYLLAEGADGSSMTRTIPMELVESGEVLVAYGMNGEMIRPENGYPLRLVVPGVQGVSWVKWLRRVGIRHGSIGRKGSGSRSTSDGRRRSINSKRRGWRDGKTTSGWLRCRCGRTACARRSAPNRESGGVACAEGCVRWGEQWHWRWGCYGR